MNCFNLIVIQRKILNVIFANIVNVVVVIVVIVITTTTTTTTTTITTATYNINNNIRLS